jgi:TonB family protein
MKFKTTLALSVLLHASLAAVFIIHPPRHGGGEMTYYVDLVQMGGGGPGGGGGPNGPGGGGARRADAAGQAEAGAALVEEKAGSVKNLTVEKEFKSPLRYPDRQGRTKVEEEQLVSVVRKERPANGGAQATPATPGGGLKTGISSGAGDGAGGPGGGWGDGSGGAFPHAYYVDMLRGRISSSWYSSLVAPGLKGKYVTGVYFVIRRDGAISDLRVERPSGIASLDLSARRAIENAAPFAPLPNDFAAQYLIVHFEFEWEKQ